MILAAISLLTSGSFAGCGGSEDNPPAADAGPAIGAECTVGGASNDDVIAIQSPALECGSGPCLQIPLAADVALPPGSRLTDLCTADCSSDEDCTPVPDSPCQTGFTCGVVTAVGPFCCRKLCMCRDYIVVPEGGLPEPAACDASNPDNRCVNLPGR